MAQVTRRILVGARAFRPFGAIIARLLIEFIDSQGGQSLWRPHDPRARFRRFLPWSVGHAHRAAHPGRRMGWGWRGASAESLDVPARPVLGRAGALVVAPATRGDGTLPVIALDPACDPPPSRMSARSAGESTLSPTRPSQEQAIAPARGAATQEAARGTRGFRPSILRRRMLNNE